MSDTPVELKYAYRLSAIRLQNFMAFEDTGWIELRPITFRAQLQRQECHHSRVAAVEAKFGIEGR